MCRGNSFAWRLIRLFSLAMISGIGIHNADATSVYECMINGQRVFSDQRCGNDAQQRKIDTPNSMPAADIRVSKTEQPIKARRANLGSDDYAKKRLACRRIREQIDAVHSHMRTGYNAAQGERLNDKLRKLNERYAQQRCDYIHN
jgi:hypothetical protein